MILYTLYLYKALIVRKKTINESLEYCRKTFLSVSVCKTTIVIIVSLTPLLFSEFKPISQLGFYNYNFT